MASLVKVGLIVAAHGIRGEIKIRSFLQPPEAMFACGALTDASGKRRFIVKKQGGNDKAFIASVEGVTDRNAAELLKGTGLYAAAGSLPKKKKGEYYSHDVIGLEAKLADGRYYGRVAQFYNFGAGDIIEITLANGETEMLPLAAPFIAVKTDHVVVNQPEYDEESKA